MSGATDTQNQTIEQTLNKTDFGHVIYENRKLVFGFLLAILVGITGYLIWKQTKHSSNLQSSVKVSEFESGAWADAKAGKKTVAELVGAFEALDERTRNNPVMLPVALEIGKFLSDKGSFLEAEAVLSKVSTGQAVASFFVGIQRAVVLEKLGKIDEAIAVLEPLAQAKEMLMPARTSLELGRLYLMKGDKGKAQTQFDYVLNTFPNDEQARLAKLYLSSLAGK